MSRLIPEVPHSETVWKLSETVQNRLKNIRKPSEEQGQGWRTFPFGVDIFSLTESDENAAAAATAAAAFAAAAAPPASGAAPVFTIVFLAVSAEGAAEAGASAASVPE